MEYICLLFGHARSAKAARFDYSLQRWRSSCRCCGAQMVRGANGGWSLRDEEERPAAQAVAPL